MAMAHTKLLSDNLRVSLLIWSHLNKLKTTPTPNQNSAYGMKGWGSYAIFGGSVCHIFCRNLLNLTDFYAIRTPIVWRILGAYSLRIWGGWGWSELFSSPAHDPC